MKQVFLLLATALLFFPSFSQGPLSKTKLKEKTIQVENINLKYVESGNHKGVPVIFLHGFTDSWHSFEMILPMLPKNIHAFAISARGHGNSDRPATGYAIRDFAQDVSGFVTKLELGPVILVGHSMGGLISQQFAIDHPHLTKGLVIVGSDFSFADNPGLPEFQAVINELKDPVAREFVAEFQGSTLGKPIDKKFYNTIIHEGLKPPAYIWKAVLNETLTVNYGDRLSSIRQPVLIIWGDKDVFCPRHDQDFLNRMLPDSKLIIYTGTGHAIHWEDPQRFTGDLVEFIETRFD